MKPLIFIIIMLYIPTLAAEEISFTYPGRIDGISGLFNTKPKKIKREYAQKSINSLMSFYRDKKGFMIFGINQVSRGDGAPAQNLGNNYPYQVASEINKSNNMSASVYSSSKVYYSNDLPNMSFTLDLVTKNNNTKGVGYYWVSIKHGKTYQASLWCIGHYPRTRCDKLNKAFLHTVRY